MTSDSRGSPGWKPGGISPTFGASAQLSLATTLPPGSCSSRKGSDKVPGTPDCPRLGPIPRISTFLVEPLGPVTMKPAIRTLSSVNTLMRVEMFKGWPLDGCGAVGSTDMIKPVPLTVTCALALTEAKEPVAEL